MTTSRPREDQNVWNFIFSLFFIGVLAGAIWFIYQENGYYPFYIPVFDAVLLALAAFRITRLMVYDKIARWFRELFVAKRYYEEGGVQYVEIRPYGKGFRHTVHDLLQCPWCIGVWSALIVTFCYFMFPWAWFAVLFLAVAGLGSLLQVSANLIGWRAEHLKRTTESL
jgi:hypothetical protein